jgi:glucose-6-phosphate 1-dehydrogenase
MSLFVPLKRATLLIPSGPSGDIKRKHLFILLTDPYPDETGKSAVLLVSISTVRPSVPHDPTCILHPGDHDFVKRDSYVVYQKARLEGADKLLRGVKSGELVAYVPMHGAVFARVCKGLEESRLTPTKLLVFYRNATTRH